MAALDGPVLVTAFEPINRQHSHTIVFLHGRGDNVQNFIRSLTHWTTSQGQTLPESLPSFRWVFPQAPLRETKLDGNMVRQWFDVWNVRDFQDQEELQLSGLRDVIPQIRNVLADEAQKLSGRWDRIILAGISMGGATSLHTLFNLNVPESGGGKLAAFMGFSCRCPFIDRDLQGVRKVLNFDNVPDHDRVLRQTPVLLEHCVDDPLVLIEGGRKVRNLLQEFGSDVSWHEYPNGGHWFNCPQGADDVLAFINRHVNPPPSMERVGQQDSHRVAQDMDLS